MCNLRANIRGSSRGCPVLQPPDVQTGIQGGAGTADPLRKHRYVSKKRPNQGGKGSKGAETPPKPANALNGLESHAIEKQKSADVGRVCRFK